MTSHLPLRMMMSVFGGGTSRAARSILGDAGFLKNRFFPKRPASIPHRFSSVLFLRPAMLPLH